MNIEKLVRKNILELQPYSSARNDYDGENGVFLDANENPFGVLNRYPDPQQKNLKQKLAELKSISFENIFIGNGSDEVIDLIYRIFCNPGIDKAITFFPTYGMYQVSAGINNIELINIPLNASFQLDKLALNDYLNDELIKVIFVCSPNNPTGNTIKNIDWLLENFKGILVVDEAYIDFSSEESFLNRINLYPNLIVMQTLSKAWGLAAARIGLGFSNPYIISLFNKIKSPYNISKLNQEEALISLNNISEFERNKNDILIQREVLFLQLKNNLNVIEVYPSDANFLLVKVKDADKVYNELIKNNIITRNRNKIVKDCIRITVGSLVENQKLIKALQNIK